MSFFESLLAILATKAAAGVAGVTVAVGAVGAAGATGHLPDDVQHAFDDIVGTAGEQAEDAGNQGENAQDVPADAPQDAVDNDHAADVLGSLTGDSNVMPGDEDFGPTVAENASEGGRDFGMNVADTASGGNSSTGAENAEQANDAGGEQPSDVPVGSDVDEEHTGGQHPDEDDAPGGPETGAQFRSQFSPRF